MWYPAVLESWLALSHKVSCVLKKFQGLPGHSEALSPPPQDGPYRTESLPPWLAARLELAPACIPILPTCYKLHRPKTGP